jgi:hypothetical protein
VTRAAGLVDYPGPRGRLTLERALELAGDARRWAAMSKVDGVCARVRLDARGRIASVLSRAGAELREAADLVGIEAGPPDCVFWGELEAHTEAGNRAAEARGWRALHLWDCTRLAGEDLSRAPFRDRWGALHRAQSWVEGEGRARGGDWTLDAGGAAHDRAGRFTRAIPRDLRRLPIAPLVRGRGAVEALWRADVELAGGEGLVLANLDAPAARARAKAKIKRQVELDAQVVEVGAGVARLSWGGRTFTVGAGGARGRELRRGQVVEVLVDGFYDGAGVVPRHPRITRLREDLAASPARCYGIRSSVEQQ